MWSRDNGLSRLWSCTQPATSPAQITNQLIFMRIHPSRPGRICLVPVFTFWVFRWCVVVAASPGLMCRTAGLLCHLWGSEVLPPGGPWPFSDPPVVSKKVLTCTFLVWGVYVRIVAHDVGRFSLNGVCCTLFLHTQQELVFPSAAVSWWIMVLQGERGCHLLFFQSSRTWAMGSWCLRFSLGHCFVYQNLLLLDWLADTSNTFLINSLTTCVGCMYGGRLRILQYPWTSAALPVVTTLLLTVTWFQM